MLPSLLAREIQDGLKHFLRTAYEPADPRFAGVMQRFTADEARWMKGPYLQIGLPFRAGAHGQHFFAGFATEHPGHVHQEAAWQRLASDRQAAGTLVATGTGSGKTECFLYPLLDHAARAARQGQEGIKALVIYPMNALATDQARRFAQVIAQTPAFKGLRVGLFVGGRSGKDGRGQMTMTPAGVITDRETLRKDPPDILLTNYKMLDYLLIRPKDRQLWAKNTAETLRYVVVDELHTFDGAQGTDLALLLRRLRARLHTPAGHLICVGTSATLGGNAETAPLREYARQVFGVAFPEGSVITENRLNEAEFLGDSPIEHVLYPRADVAAVLDAEQYATPQAAIAAWFGLFFPTLEVTANVDDPDWRVLLGEVLKSHLLFHNLLKLMKGRIVALDALQQQLQGPLPVALRPAIGPVLDALLALVAWARNAEGRPLVTLRVQLWMRELRRMVTQVQADPARIELRADSDVRREEGKLYLPLLQCADCHTTGWLTRLPNGQSRVATDLDVIYNAWFAGQPEAVRLYAPTGLQRPLCAGLVQHLCTQCGNLQGAPGPCVACGHEVLVDVFRTTAVRSSTNAASVAHSWHDPSCPACGSRFRQLLLGARNSTLGAVSIEQAWASPFNDDKKLIAFSDAVQDAAHRAGFFTARTYLNTVRTGLAQVIDCLTEQAGTSQCAWNDFLEHSAALWLAEGSPLKMPVERFVAEFIGPDMMWQRDWATSLQGLDRLPEGSRLPGRVQKRLAWQAFAEFTYVSRRGRTLNAIGKATLAPRLADIEAAAAVLLPILHERFGIRHAERPTVVQWLWGFVCHLRSRGAVMHPELVSFARDGNVFALTHAAGRNEWLPRMGDRTPHPIFLSLNGGRGFDAITGTQGATFFQTWLEATLGAGGLLPGKATQALYQAAIEVLAAREVLQQVDGNDGAVIGLNPAALVLETQLARLLSSQGKRALTVPAEAVAALLGMPCLDAPQERYAREEPAGGWLARRFSRGDLRRVFSAEHTGLLQRDQREALETRFKAKVQQAWHENLLSATPTLEMGVDIGDLSSVLLCSVPPNQASYLQRIGRAGRRDGNAFTATLADGNSPHDLYFFEDTEEMLQGEVQPPGIFLKAAEVLRRQLFAYCLDDWVGSGVADAALPDKTKDALDARDSHDQTRFPFPFLDHVQAHEERLLAGFKSLLGDDLDERVARRLEGFMQGTEEDNALRLRLFKLLEELAEERKAHRERGEQIKKRIATLKGQAQDDATRNEIELLTRERQKTIELVREINQRDLLNTLTDAGLIPNYAFPEAGVELKSLLWRKKGSDDPANAGAYISLPAERYERPAQSALSEFAPENVFYANQRRVEIDQINMSLSSLEEWRLCPSCQHMENLAKHADSHASCPRCGDPLWANVAQKRSLLRFRQAIANSNDADVRIDDSAEDREPKFYLRQMLADFEPSDIVEAYRLKADDLPFGFEFIERVVFRDVNFGEPTRPGETYLVAGQQKARPGFKLCRHCGQVQRPPRSAREREQGQRHAFDCDKRGSNAPANLIDCLYLYREFASEALRILVPYTKSGVDEASVQSFMAALRIGLKKRFGGKVDHLRMVTQEERSPDGAQNGTPARQYVLLFDSVPGGTGYLHELLANDARTLVDVLRIALTHLAACGCNADPDKDGCYRCVYQYRLGRAMALVSRDRARNILEQLVGSLDQLERVASIAEIYINPNFDSELEARFIESLRRLGGQGGLPFVKLVQEIVQGKSGYLLEVGAQRYWVEPQVDLGPGDGVSVPCRPDFVLWPTQGHSPRRPIAVFCDGWTYHQASTRADAAKRSALVASGRFWIWSVTWDDVQSALDGKLDTALGEDVEAMCLNPRDRLPPPLRAMLSDELGSRHAVASLLRWLGSPTTETSDPQAVQHARHAGALSFRMVPNPADAALADVRGRLEQFWQTRDDWHCEPLAQSAACGNVNTVTLQLRYRWPGALASSTAPLPTSPGFVILDEAQAQDEPQRHRAWRAWLWLFNLFQTLPGILLATRDGLDAGDHAAYALTTRSRPAGGGAGAAHAAAWMAIIDEAMASLAEGLHTLLDAGMPPPEAVGYELEEAGDVVAEAELAWINRKRVLLMPAHAGYLAAWQSRGWTAWVAEDGWPQRLLAEFDEHDE